MKFDLIYFDDQIENIECFKVLLRDKFNVIGRQDIRNYKEILNNNRPHLILLDVHMPIMNGHELYEKMINDSAYNDCPVIFISTDHTDENKIHSYDRGGVDFLTRDMSPDEIEARLSSKIKLYLQTATKLSLGNLKLDFESMKVFINGGPIDLTLIEMRILGCLLRAVPETMTRADLMKKVWGGEAVKPGTINTHVTNFKSKLQGWTHTILTRQELVLIREAT